MNRHALEDRVVFLQLKTLGGVLFILCGDVARRSRLPAFLVLGALQYHLYSVSFFCHDSLNVIKLCKNAVCLGFLQAGADALFVDVL